MGDSKFSNFDNMSLQGIDEDSELIPLLTPEDEEQMNSEVLPETLPILPLRNTVLFPGVVMIFLQALLSATWLRRFP